MAQATRPTSTAALPRCLAALTLCVAASALPTKIIDGRITQGDAGALATPPTPWPAPHGHAYYKLASTDLANASWPAGFEHYSVFVANPGFSAAELSKVKATVPGAMILAYSDMSWAYVGTGCSQGE